MPKYNSFKTLAKFMKERPQKTINGKVNNCSKQIKETLLPPLSCFHIARTVGSAHKCNKNLSKKQETHIKFIVQVMRMIGSYYGSFYAKKEVAVQKIWTAIITTQRD